jgi:queuosine precursor transporter
MNAFIFFIHIFLVFTFGLGALRLGKEALIGWVALQAVLANLFVIKQIDFFGFEITCSDAFAVGSFFGLNLLQEYFGRKTTLTAIKVCFFSMLFFALMAQIHLLYKPSLSDTTQDAFRTILEASPRLFIASLATFAIAQQIDLRLFRKLSFLSSFSLKNTLALSCSQLIDTIIFSFLGLYDIVSSLFDVIFISFLVKLVIILCLKPFTQCLNLKSFIHLKNLPQE